VFTKCWHLFKMATLTWEPMLQAMTTSEQISPRIVSVRLLALAILAAGTLVAGNGSASGGSSGVVAPNAAEVRTPSERVPAGGTVQVKYLLTQPRPIGSAGSRMATLGFNVNGVSIFSPLGDAAGAAVWQNGFLDVSVISPNGDYGTNADYPFMTVTMTTSPSAAAGSSFPLGLAGANYVGPLGPLTLTDAKPGTLTIGGSISIHNITPGGGTWPSGTVVHIEGTGFTPATKLSAKLRMSPVVYDSPTELHFTLLDSSTPMDMQPITASNPDGSLVTYYAYQRGVPVQKPSRNLLMVTDPIFQSQTHGVASLAWPVLASGQFVALALQNPSPGPVVVTFQLQSSGAVSTILLPPGARVMDDVSVLLGGASPAAHETVNISSTAGVQILGLLGDENAGTVKPFLPAF
jgi:hypothetical protein